MPKQMPVSSIAKAVLDGFAHAQANYERWSGGSWLWQAPEYFISSTVARYIAELNGAKYLTLEHGAKSALTDAGAKGKGRLPQKIREKGKVDILLWWGDGTPRAVIEIKNQIYATDQYRKDIERITGFLSRNNSKSSLQFGIFAYYESAQDGARKTATEKIKDRIETVCQNCISYAGNNFRIEKVSSSISVVDDNAWAAICLIIKQKT